ncbi:TetR/AcrR family transcriptional regulator [Nonomuraea sp. NPDC059007]|uniref:TetR/AcrR family transcriptional regulator n=1 Tax=Nonomuraea sp. NPDC059007 TaxID=3346692 RepID=UPI00368479DD
MHSQDTRTRIVRAAAELLQRQGYEGASVKPIAKAAGASVSSVYHFFPGGKQELAVEALRHGAAEYADLLSQGMATSADPAEGVAACAHLMVSSLKTSSWVDGCPVAVTALETVGRVPGIQQAAEEALAHWQQLVSTSIQASGVPADTADELASTVISTLEGAELLSRVRRDALPLLRAADHLSQLVRLTTQGTTQGTAQGATHSR